MNIAYDTETIVEMDATKARIVFEWESASVDGIEHFVMRDLRGRVTAEAFRPNTAVRYSWNIDWVDEQGVGTRMSGGTDTIVQAQRQAVSMLIDAGFKIASRKTAVMK